MLDNYDPNVWKEAPDRPGYRVKTIKHGNATIEVYRPILSEAEQKKRESYAASVAGSVLASYYKRMEEQKNHEQQNHD